MNIDSVNKALERSGDGVDMERPVTVVSRELVYQGADFQRRGYAAWTPSAPRRADGNPQTGHASCALRGHAGA